MINITVSVIIHLSNLIKMVASQPHYTYTNGCLFLLHFEFTLPTLHSMLSFGDDIFHTVSIPRIYLLFSSNSLFVGFYIETNQSVLWKYDPMSSYEACSMNLYYFFCRFGAMILSFIIVSFSNLGVAWKLIGNALPISARVGKVNLAVNLGYIAGLMP